MRVGIEINGVLRDTIGKIIQVYQKNYMESEDVVEQSFQIDESGNTEIIETIEEFKYSINLPVTTLNLEEHFKFRDKQEFYSFLYEEFSMEIFGHASSTEYTSFNDLNDLYISLRNEIDFSIVSDEISKSKPASLFFLSKFGCLIESVKFYSTHTINSMWNDIDILLTSNPALLLDYPENKIVIKFDTDYNKEINTNYSIKSLKELSSLLKQIKDVKNSERTLLS